MSTWVSIGRPKFPANHPDRTNECKAALHAAFHDLRAQRRRQAGRDVTRIGPSCSYLTDVLTRIVSGHPNSQIDDLLPWAYILPPELKTVA